MTDQRLEVTSEPDTRDDPKYEKLVDAFERGDLDAEFVAWAVSYQTQRTGDAIAETNNDGAARALYQDFVAANEAYYARGTTMLLFDVWLVRCAPDLHANEIATILREEDAASKLRDDDYGWRPVKEFLAHQWEQRSEPHGD